MRKLLISAALTLTMIGGVTASSATILTGKNESINKKVEDKISTMTLEEKVGQMMFYGVNGTNVDDKVVNLFEVNMQEALFYMVIETFGEVV